MLAAYSSAPEKKKKHPVCCARMPTPGYCAPAAEAQEKLLPPWPPQTEEASLRAPSLPRCHGEGTEWPQRALTSSSMQNLHPQGQQRLVGTWREGHVGGQPSVTFVRTGQVLALQNLRLWKLLFCSALWWPHL